VRAIGARIDLDCKYLSLSPRQHFHGGNHLGRDVIRNQVGEALFFGQYVGDTFDLPGAVLDSKQDEAARSIGECHNGFEDVFGGGKIALNG